MEVFRLLAPQIPSLANAAVWHSMGMTPTSSKWDLRTSLTIHVLRRMMRGDGSKPKPIGEVQAYTLKDPGVKGKTWIATEKIIAPRPEHEGLRDAVFKAIEDLTPTDAGELNYTKPDLVDIEVEWTGFRPGAGKNEAPPDLPETEKYKKLMAEPSRTSETTILYFHGGAYYLCDPSTHRLYCSKLAKHTNGRVCSVRYRLAPKMAFPGQLLDAFLVYMSLLYPPPGSMHEPIPAKNIVFGGDSAGGNLSFVLLQLLLQLNRGGSPGTVRFHGQDVQVPLPAGAFANSGWFDISRSMPSIEGNLGYDYLPAPKDDAAISHFPKDALWPAQPPRGDLYCDLTLLDHPLVSPFLANWEGSPPLWLCTGEECLRDEDALVATEAVAQGVKVQYEEYEAMPHVFSMLLGFLPTAKRCLESCSAFCKACVEGPGSIQTSGTYVFAKTGKEEPIVLSEASKFSLEEAGKLVGDTKQRRTDLFDKHQNSKAAL